jgi:PAS domain S-box-containing protein
MRRLLTRLPTSTLMGLAFTIPAMLLAGFLLYYHTLVARKYLSEEGVRYAEILADQILSASQRFLRLGSVAAVQEMIEDTGSTRSVMHVALVGSDGKIIASNRRDWVGQDDAVIPEPSYQEVATAARATFQTQHRLVEGNKQLILVSPLLVQGANPILWNSRGILYLKIDQERKLHEIYATILTRGAVSALGILVISLFLLIWVRAILARPILSVASFLRDFAAGNAEAPPRVAGTLEVAQLIEDVGRMVRDLKEKQAALAASEERHRLLLEGAYDAILTADPETGQLLEVNGMFCRLFGYTREEARTLTLKDLHAPEERGRLMRDYAASVGEGQRDFHDIPCVRRGGARFLVDVRGGAISIKNRTVSEWILRDTTERKRLEDQLRQAQKMESVATLAGGIAHDFNNLLTGIMGYARLVLRKMGPEDPNRKQIEPIERSARRAAELTAQLLTFSRRAASRPAPVDLNLLLEEIVKSLRADLPPNIELLVQSAPDLWTAAVDRSQLEQAILHLCANAREAMPEGGRLAIETANRTIGEADSRGNLESRAGRFVTLTVQDTGRGIDPGIRGRIFEPFFTTKTDRKGAGLGLAMVYGSIKGHDGWIEVSSEPGRGSRFVICLPMYDPAAERPMVESPADLLARLAGAAAKGSAPAPASAGLREPNAAGAREAASAPAAPGEAAAPDARATARRTILAVDDESTVLALAKDILELHGYRVLTARNGEEALRLYREHAGGVDLVLLDLTMPVMGGVECFREMQRIDPSVRVVVSSGFSSESTATEILRDGALGYVQKPYDIDLLARIVREALAKNPSAAAAPHPN